LEAYYQEAGRAGRDGLPARCLMLFGPGDLMTQRRLQRSGSTSQTMEARQEQGLAAVEQYATTSTRCRQEMLCAHFTGSDDHDRCGLCDVCADPDAVQDQRATDAGPPVELTPLPPAAKEVIAAAAGNLRRPVGKSNLAKALRGSRAKTLHRGGLMGLPEHGALAEYDEPSIVAAIDQLLAYGTLERRGRKYPTIWLRGKPVRESTRSPARGETSDQPAKPRRAGGRRASELARAMDNYRRRMARELSWKAYMVFQRRVILAVDRQRPDTMAALERIPGLGPAKLERFGDDILAMVRRHRE
ncbi:MAG TPA: HRDC domain-containing protein, partial [Kofleriaceae bacterium]|nr:HRDC domain-containing protein [Kofleriaceae bacterium]